MMIIMIAMIPLDGDLAQFCDRVHTDETNIYITFIYVCVILACYYFLHYAIVYVFRKKRKGW